MKIPAITPVKVSNSIKYAAQKTAKFLEPQPQKGLLPNSWKKSKTTGLTTNQLIGLILRNL